MVEPAAISALIGLHLIAATVMIPTMSRRLRITTSVAPRLDLAHHLRLTN